MCCTMTNYSCMCCTMTNYIVHCAVPRLITVLCAVPRLITVLCAVPRLITVLCAVPRLITVLCAVPRLITVLCAAHKRRGYRHMEQNKTHNSSIVIAMVMYKHIHTLTHSLQIPQMTAPDKLFQLMNLRALTFMRQEKKKRKKIH